MKKRIIILGAGFAGLSAASELDGLAGNGTAEVTLIDKADKFSMGFSMQWFLVGRRKAEDGYRYYKNLSMKHVKFLNDEVVSIDAKSNEVCTSNLRLSYDYLIIALGTRMDPISVAGLEDAHNLYDIESVKRLKEKIENIKSGTVLIAITSTPFKCPPAPYEYAMLIDDVLRKRKLRKNVRIILTTVEPQPMPIAGKAVGNQFIAMLADKGIEYHTLHKIKMINPKIKEIEYENGLRISYDIFAAIYPHAAPRLLKDAGFTNETGFIPVDLFTMKTSHENVYATGDVTVIKLPDGKPHPKAGIFAEAQAAIAAKNIIAKIEKIQPPKYDGKGACFIDVGEEKAAVVESNLLAAEAEKVIFGLPSSEGIEAKKKFEREHLEKWFNK